MLIYNVTVKIDADVHDQWLEWMQKKHIPEVLATGCFLENRICKVLGDDGPDGTSYAFQYLVQDQATLHRYIHEYAPALQKDHTSRYEGKFVAFRTVMEVVAMTNVLHKN